MTFQRALAGAGCRVPEIDRVVPASGRKKPSVGRKRHGSDSFTAYSLKKLVLTLLASLAQRLFGASDGHLDRGRVYWP
jgi:hypothetical protein